MYATAKVKCELLFLMKTKSVLVIFDSSFSLTFHTLGFMTSILISLVNKHKEDEGLGPLPLG
jgi:hypothetical protein